MNIAIYSRKSRLVEGSESIENQIEMCKEYIRKNIKSVDDISVYEDEGFSGGNINRPQFKKMLKDAKNKMFNILVCYRLDRISRNVADFSGIITELQNLNIDFISIKEQFDTSNPMGRAMLYISSVFAQLERETIAERVKDNMLELSKSGKWLGGNEPFGYKLGKNSILEVDKAKSKIVINLFKKYIEYDSLTQVVKYAIRENITTKNGKIICSTSMRRILANPIYVIADENIYLYCKNKEMTICNSLKDFKNNLNSYGIMAYNKTYQSSKKNKNNVEKDWIIALGQHKGILDSNTWITVQDRIKENSFRAPRTGAQDALLSGILKCADCKDGMRVMAGYYKGKRKQHYYKCRTKAISNSLLCNIKNANGSEADKTVLNYIKKLSENEKLVDDLFKKSKKNLIESNPKDELKELEKVLTKNKSDIEKLTEKLIIAENSVATKYIVKKIETLDEEIKEINKKIISQKSNKAELDMQLFNLEIFKETLNYAAKNIDSFPLEKQKQIVKNLFKEIIWDGKKLSAIPRI